MSQCTRRFLRRHGLSTAGDTKVSEYTIKPGDSVFVLGTLDENRGLGGMAEAKERNPGGTYVSREAADLQRLEQLDAIGIPPSEPCPASPADGKPDFDLHPRVVLRGGDHGQPFVLSRQPPQRLIDGLASGAVPLSLYLASDS